MKLRATVWVAGADPNCDIIVKPPVHIYLDTPFLVHDKRFGKIIDAHESQDGQSIEAIIKIDDDKIDIVKGFLENNKVGGVEEIG